MKPFRSAAGSIVSWVWLAVAAVALVDVAIRGRDRASAIAAAVLLLGCGLAYALGLRPRVVAEKSALAVHNPFRTTRLPWKRIEEIRPGRVLSVTWDGGRVEAWAVQSSARAAARARRAEPDPRLPGRLAEQAAGRTPVDFAAEQLEEVRARSEGDGEVAVTWSWPALLAVLAPLGALAALLVG
ncbi:PH domain-containing protein [Actinocorallia populi]|uniref:PH domain-containing protein n=1 Tax=Actinocorallia populi TaxID=2079200 RepID=UPI000D08B612|nr:PH domain-containing protein [Actinocorallia populi]